MLDNRTDRGSNNESDNEIGDEGDNKIENKSGNGDSNGDSNGDNNGLNNGDSNEIKVGENGGEEADKATQSAAFLSPTISSQDVTTVPKIYCKIDTPLLNKGHCFQVF